VHEGRSPRTHSILKTGGRRSFDYTPTPRTLKPFLQSEGTELGGNCTNKSAMTLDDFLFEKSSKTSDVTTSMSQTLAWHTGSGLDARGDSKARLEMHEATSRLSTVRRSKNDFADLVQMPSLENVYTDLSNVIKSVFPKAGP
jgi:hypothetical protein